MVDGILGLAGRGDQKSATRILAGSLIGGLFGLAPAIALTLDAVGLGLLTSSVLALSIAGVQYGALALYYRRIELALMIGLIVTMTVSANVPLGPASDRLLSLGPQIWLVQIPLAGLLGLYAITGKWRRIELTRPHLLLGGAVLWMVVAAPFSAGPRTDVALYFALLMLQAFVVFVLSTSAVRTGLLSFRQIVGVLTATAVAHAAVATVQFVNGDSFGLTFLGETSGSAARIALGPFGTYSTGKFVTGFAGGGPFSSLVTFAAPVALVFAYRAEGRARAGWAVGFVLLSVALRASSWDAGRGSYLIALVSLFVVASGIALLERQPIDRLRSRIPSPTIPTTLAAGLGAILWPSSAAGSRTETSNLDPAGPQREGANPTDPPVQGGNGSANGPSGSDPTCGFEHLDPDPILESVESLSIPLFDLSNLAVRIQQYVAGIDLFLQYPIFGIGGANFTFISQSMGVKNTLPLHNMYIGLLAETGLLGFVLYVGAIVSAVIGGLRSIGHETPDRLLVVGTLSGLVGYLALMMLQVQILRIESLFPFWLLAGALVGHSIGAGEGAD